ncbi:hypothetical protein A2U01_0040945 [Trifolium medium]|uniref:Uncharacterized protein n=1 Tax=Trifolium medium TaxID=97028 RepID=A0A392Q957_9FABA|nr:hypothetical protein [Trifolium medium]
MKGCRCRPNADGYCRARPCTDGYCRTRPQSQKGVIIAPDRMQKEVVLTEGVASSKRERKG